jgi:hypothetical protein
LRLSNGDCQSNVLRRRRRSLHAPLNEREKLRVILLIDVSVIPKT